MVIDEGKLLEKGCNGGFPGDKPMILTGDGDFKGEAGLALMDILRHVTAFRSMLIVGGGVGTDATVGGRVFDTFKTAW